MLARVCNLVWARYCAPESRHFRRACESVEATQEDVLIDMLRKNANTEFGNRYQFRSIKNVDEYRERVSIAEWGDLIPWIDRIAEGKQRVLTYRPPSVLEPTGGSTSGQKLIPYTTELRRQFQRAIRVWIYDLLSNRPALRRGRSYWSISPLANRPQTTSGGIKIGFESDSAYLTSAEQILLLCTLAVPPSVARCKSVEVAQFATMFHLLNAPDLALISVWSPTFLTLLLDFFEMHAERLCDSLQHGKLHIPIEWGRIPDAVQASIRPSVQRAEQTRTCLRDCSGMPELVQSLWPGLRLVSCWSDGPSACFANELKSIVGSIEIQGKGLLATEAFVTIPLISEPAPALAIRSHFFEFLPVNRTESSATVLAHELVEDERYDVIVTTGGGLYRYRLRDEVQVIGHMGDVPLLRFVGRTDHTMDLVGEKLTAAHLQSVLDRSCNEFGMAPTFAEVIPALKPHRRYEVLIADRSLSGRHVDKHRFAQAIEAGLRENPGYEYARSIGQLGAVDVRCLSIREAQQRSKEMIATALGTGVRLGDIKPGTLSQSAV